MLPIPRHYAHYIFGVLQSGLTSGIASLIASLALLDDGGFLANWLKSWLIAWAIMLPVVVFAAPFIQKLAIWLTRPPTGP